MKIKKIIQLAKSVKINFRRQLNFSIYKQYLPADPRQDDLYIVEFPKSGITWLSTIIANIYIHINNKNDKEFVTFFNIKKYMCEIGLNNNVFIGNLMENRIIRSHSTFNPYYLMTIYILRNPFDVMISYYNYMQSLGWKGDFIKFIKSEEHGIYAWKKHVNGWINESHGDNQMIHLIKYEDLMMNTFFEIKKILNNLGLKVDDDIIKEAIEHSSLDNMKKSEEFYRSNSPGYTMSFVGKEGKIPKEKLLTDYTKKYILKETKDILKKFYPDLLNKDYI